MQKTVLLFGAGKSATALIHYLIAEASINNWAVIIADTDKRSILLKTNNSPLAEALEINVEDNEQRSALIQRADIVISLMPPSLHFLIAKDCVAYNKNLLTASYIDESIKALQSEIEKKGLLFICEMGLDPGIDHMSAMELIDSIHAKGAKIISFKSHCGGLVAPESDNNPWHYKISWNPKNVVMAGKAGAVYKSDYITVKEKYEELFDPKRGVEIPRLGFLSYYPNRDSRDYIDLYRLQDAKTFMRTTLRHREFMLGWKNLIELKLTDETKKYQTDRLLLFDFFKKHFDENGFEYPVTKSAAAISNQVPQADLIANQLFYLGFDDSKTLINKGTCNTADILQFILETKLALQPGDKDMVVMLHELIVSEANKMYNVRSSMIVKGENEVHTAMAKTVGLPLGIAAKLILNNTIELTGLQVPVKKEIYEPVLKELKNYGIFFEEELIPIS